MDPGADSNERADPAARLDPAGGRVHDLVDDLQQRRLAGSVDADEADRARPGSTAKSIPGSAQRQRVALAPAGKALAEPAELVLQIARAPVGAEALPDLLGLIVPSGDVRNPDLETLEDDVADDEDEDHAPAAPAPSSSQSGGKP